jgi:hypothetical protein
MSSPAMFSEAHSPLTGGGGSFGGSAEEMDMEDSSAGLEKRSMQGEIVCLCSDEL